MGFIKSFFSGFVSTLIFHQGVLWILNLAGLINRAPFNLAPTPPFQIPAVISLSFWGGIWGILLWKILIGVRKPFTRFFTALGFGALCPSLAALAVVLPLKGGAFMAGWNPKIILGALILNGTWGIGVALFLRILKA